MISIGNVYVADYKNHRIRKVTVSTGIISTIAGTGLGSYSGDGGAATSATLNQPFRVALDAAGTIILCCFVTFIHYIVTLNAGNVFIADTDNLCIRKVTIATGFISTVAGTGTAKALSGDGGEATSAELKSPAGVAADASGNSMVISFILFIYLFAFLGNVYIADTDNHRLRKVTAIASYGPR